MHPERVFTSLHLLIDIDRMLEEYRRTRKDGATGIDDITAADQRPICAPNGAVNLTKAGRS